MAGAATCRNKNPPVVAEGQVRLAEGQVSGINSVAEGQVSGINLD